VKFKSIVPFILVLILFSLAFDPMPRAQAQDTFATISPEMLSMVTGAVLSLVFSYVPGLNAWFAKKEKETQQLYMLGLMIIVAGAAFGLACGNVLYDLFGVVLNCDRAGALTVVKALLLAIAGNQTVYRITPHAKAVREVKAAREGAADLELGRE
jgi:uncharacterized membrane protein